MVFKGSMKLVNSQSETEVAQPITTVEKIRGHVIDALATTPVFDMHTHLFPTQFGELNLWGIDALLTYHYLIAELFRFSRISTDDFWKLSRSQQADLIWETLFVRQTPLSEATRGVVAVLTALDLDPAMEDLR